VAIDGDAVYVVLSECATLVCVLEQQLLLQSSVADLLRRRLRWWWSCRWRRLCSRDDTRSLRSWRQLCRKGTMYEYGTNATPPYTERKYTMACLPRDWSPSHPWSVERVLNMFELIGSASGGGWAWVGRCKRSQRTYLRGRKP
jgi:hypothetical protein